jgi:hypothetical protein
MEEFKAEINKGCSKDSLKAIKVTVSSFNTKVRQVANCRGANLEKIKNK